MPKLTEYEKRVRELEADGLTRSDAQSAADVEFSRLKSKATHTPGPWKAVSYTSRWNVTTAGNPRTFNICSINSDRIEQQANAALIAAAPELLEAAKLALEVLKEMDTAWEPGDGEIEPIGKLTAAIRKAEGGE